MLQTIKKVRYIGIGLSILGVFFLVFSWFFVEITPANDIKEIGEISKEYRTALILGTSTRLDNGWRNLFHYYRVRAIVQLVQADKIDTVLVSGDNGRVDYNEPEAIRDDLITYGVPADMIELDYAGFRTLDSIVRSRTAFSKPNIIIVSQRFHIERALVIADKFDIDAVGFAAADVSYEVAPRVYIREVLARVKMMFDLYVLGTGPKFEI